MNDYEIDDDTDTDSVSEEGCSKETEPIYRQSTFIVFKSSLMELLKFCNKCGAALNQALTEEHQNMGSQLSYHFRCVKGTTSYHCCTQV